MKPFSIVVALDDKNGIGKNNNLAWRLSADLKHFKELTTKVSDPLKQNALIMGRKTWDSLPEKYKPLPGRLNIVLSRQQSRPLFVDVLLSSSLEDILKDLKKRGDIESVFVIGGAQIYSQSIHHPSCSNLYITQVKGDFICDAFFPAIPDSFKIKEESSWQTEGSIQYRFCQYQKI
ncbi:MAG: dihydrofolate reductase [Candidatus Omnitrophica bacterium]|nr:dihydrofolate reductase [Candidatus Omnitrophota bacterium]